RRDERRDARAVLLVVERVEVPTGDHVDHERRRVPSPGLEQLRRREGVFAGADDVQLARQRSRLRGAPGFGEAEVGARRGEVRFARLPFDVTALEDLSEDGLEL